MGSLTDQILTGIKVEAPVANTTLADTVLSTPKKELSAKVSELNSKNEAAKNRSGFVQGLKDILNGIGNLVAQDRATRADLFLPEKLAAPMRNAAETIKTEAKEDTAAFDAANPKSDGLIPNLTEAGRMAGQVVGSAPVLPVRAMGLINTGMRALPIATATGEKLAAPIVNRLGASAVTGGLGGAEFGALTDSTNDEGLGKNMGVGLITGALTGPLLTAAATGAQKTLPTIKSMWANVQLNKLASDAGMDPGSIKNVISILENAGYTPKEAQIALNKLGPQATLADLAQSIQTEASGLASFGGKPTELLKGRFEGRSKTANSQAHDLMEQRLGPKPDIEAEKTAIIKKVQNEVKPDYEAAYNSGAQLDINKLVSDIDSSLKTAVGDKAAALEKLKGFLYTKDGALKNDVPSLHEIRQAIDDVLDKRDPTTSYGKNAVRAINDVRSGIDDALKSVPEFVAADNKFASKMQIINDIDTGYDVLKKGMNKEEFARFFGGLSPDRQEAVKKGLRANIGDLMEQASRGELSEAQRLFGKTSVNRANLEKAFGNRGTEVLDALEREATERGTERAVMHGAQTAERQAVQRKYGERTDNGGGSQILQGLTLDIISGTPGGATALMTAKRAGGAVKLRMSEGRRERLIEGTADLISRQGAERNVGLDVANKAHKINNLISQNRLPVAELPTYLLSAPIGEGGYSSYKKLGKE